MIYTFDFLSFLGVSSSHGLYMQVRVMQWRDGTHYPLSTFWTDRYLSRINPDKVYFYSPGLRRFKSSTVLGSYVAWLDFDASALPEFHRRPSLLISTGGGFHAYWRFNDFVYSDMLTQVLNVLCEMYPVADRKVRDITRFLRYPGSFNCKYVPPRKVEVIDFSGLTYNVGDVIPF